MSKPQRLISIAAEGGSIEVYRDTSNPARTRFKVMVVDHTPTFLDSDDGGPVSRRNSGWLDTWSAAIDWLGRYPWPHLVGRYVDSSVAAETWSALEAYIARTGQSVHAAALERWREVCLRVPR